MGSLIPVNRGWTGARSRASTVYLADNGIHADIVMPVKADGLDWAPLIPHRDFAARRSDARWIAFGSGEQQVYLETPPGGDIRPRTIWSALTGGKRVMHVEYVPSPYYAAREIRLRPEEYRRLWAAIRERFRLDPRADRSASTIPATALRDAFYRGDRQGQRGQHLQQLGGEPAAPRRREDQPVAALRPGAGVALSEADQSTYLLRSVLRAISASWLST